MNKPKPSRCPEHSKFKPRIRALGWNCESILARNEVPTYRNGSNRVFIRCVSPFHEDKNPSFSLDLSTGHGHCFACGHWVGDIVALHKELGGFLTMGDALADLEGLSGQPTPKLQIIPSPQRRGKRGVKSMGRPITVGTWSYYETDGALAFTIERVQYELEDGSWFTRPGSEKPHKDYFPRTPEGQKRMPRKYSGGELRPLYALTEILAAQSDQSDQRIIVVEGEPAADVHRNGGHLGTTSISRSGLAMKTDWSPLAGRKIVIWPDNDAAGLKYMKTVISCLRNLYPICSVSRVEIEAMNLPEHGDSVDWLRIQESLRNE